MRVTARAAMPLAARANRSPRYPDALTTATAYEPALPRERSSEPIGVVGALEEPEDVLEQNLRGVPDRAAAEELEGSVATLV
jgi:hypothetical protein